MICIENKAYADIVKHFTTTLPECGGVLGAVDGKTITHFYFDTGGVCTAWSYAPDCEQINEMLVHSWAPQGVQMVGIIHSHSNAGDFPSCGDLYYCEQIMSASNLTEFLLPIVTLSPFQIHMYVVTYSANEILVHREEIKII